MTHSQACRHRRFGLTQLHLAWSPVAAAVHHIAAQSHAVHLLYIQVAKSKKELREKEEREAAAKKAADDWKAKQDAEKKLSDERKAATAAGPEKLAEFEAKLAAEAERRRWTDEDEKAYWAEIKRINDEKKAEATAEAKRRKALTKEQREAEDQAKKEEEERKKKEDEEMVLVEEVVVPRGNGIAQESIDPKQVSRLSQLCAIDPIVRDNFNCAF